MALKDFLTFKRCTPTSIALEWAKAEEFAEQIELNKVKFQDARMWRALVKLAYVEGSYRGFCDTNDAWHYWESERSKGGSQEPPYKPKPFVAPYDDSHQNKPEDSGTEAS